MEEETIAKTRQRGPLAENSDGNDSTNTPPVKPGNEDSTDGESAERPEMPEMNCEESEDSEAVCEPPEKPEDMEGFEGGPMDGGFPGEVVNINNQDSVLHPVGYLSLGAGSVIISTVIMYACFSNFFHKKPASTFDKWQKFMWFVISVVILSTGLVALCYFVPIWIN